MDPTPKKQASAFVQIYVTLLVYGVPSFVLYGWIVGLTFPISSQETAWRLAPKLLEESSCFQKIMTGAHVKKYILTYANCLVWLSLIGFFAGLFLHKCFHQAGTANSKIGIRRKYGAYGIRYESYIDFLAIFSRLAVAWVGFAAFMAWHAFWRSGCAGILSHQTRAYRSGILSTFSAFFIAFSLGAFFSAILILALRSMYRRMVK